MASLSELNLKFRLYMKMYRFKHYDTSPNTPLRKPLNQCRVALITTAGLYLPEQSTFDENVSGDCSYREIPNSVDTQVFAIGHKSESYDTSGTQIDANLAFPLDRFRELETEGKIGSLNRRHFSFMGSIPKPKPLITQTAPEVGQMLKDDDVDVAFLTPV